MRTRRRPALQDKTPGNTPQSRHLDASKAKEVVFSAPCKPLEALPIAPEAIPVISDENGTPLSVPPSPKPHHVRRVPQPPPEPLEDTGSELSAPPTPTPARIRRPGGPAIDAFRYSSDIRSDAAHRSDILSAAMLPVREEREPLAYGASDDSSAAPSPSPVKTMKWPTSTIRPIAPPRFRPLVEHAPSPLPTKHARMSSSSRPSGSLRPSGGLAPPPPPPQFFEQRTPPFVPPTPRPKHVQTLLRPANDEEGVLASPTPVKTGLGPLLAQSTPLQFHRRRPRLPLNKLPSRTAEAMATTSKAKGKQRAREESLPPSSPPPPSPSGSHVPFGVRADLMAELDDEPLEPDDKENTAAPPAPLQKERSRSSEDDPFGFLAAERKLKMLRREKGQGSVQGRRPLGTLSVSRRTPSAGPSTAPLQLPTPDGDSDADEEPGDDRFMGVGSPGLAQEELPDPGPSDPIVPPAYDDHSDALSYADPEDVVMDTGDLEDNDKENAAPDAPAESIPASPEVAPPRTPHKPKSARKRSPLPTPHFECDSSEVGEGTPSRSMGPIEELELPSPPPARMPLPSSAARDDDAVEDALGAEPAQEGESEDMDEQKEETPKPSAPVTRKRRREQAEDEDPVKAAKKLEKLLPRRPVKRAKRASAEESEEEEPLAKRTRGRGRGKSRGAARGAAGRGRGRGKGKARAEEAVSGQESGTESDEEEEEDVKPKPSSSRGRATRGRGAPSSRGSSRGRGRGTSSRPPSSSTRITRSRSQKPPSKSKPESKGKKRAREEDEEIDIEEDEVRSGDRLRGVVA